MPAAGEALGGAPDQHGIHVSDGGGNESTLDLLEALAEGGVAFGGFADNEDVHPVRWQTLIAAQGAKVFRWDAGCLEDNIIGAVADASLEALAADAEGRKTGQRLRTLQERLGTADKAFATLRAAAPGDRLSTVFIEAAKGTVPDGTAEEDRNHLKSHAQTWFKSLDGGRELADKMFAFALWPAFNDRLLPFCNAVLTAVGIDAVADLQP